MLSVAGGEPSVTGRGAARCGPPTGSELFQIFEMHFQK